MADLKNYAIGTLTIALLISLGINVSPDATHFCRSSELAKICYRISSTGGRCYPLPGVTIGYKDCSTKWESLVKDSLSTEQKVRVQANGGSYECSCCDLTSYTTCTKNDGKQAYLGELI